MKKWMKYLFLSVLIITAFSVNTVSAKNVATAHLSHDGDSREVAVAVELSEGATEVITSMHFSLIVSLQEGAIPEGTMSFVFASGLTSTVKDAGISWNPELPGYIVDIVLSGTEEQDIFPGETTRAEIGTLIFPEINPADEGTRYYAEVGLAAPSDSGDGAADVIEPGASEAGSSAAALQYVESAGLQAITVELKTGDQVCIGEKKVISSPDPQTPETEPQTPETQPQTPDAQPEPEPLPQTPIPEPQGPLGPEPQPQTPEAQSQTPETQPESQTPETQPQTPAEPQSESQTPETEPQIPETKPQTSGEKPSQTKPGTSQKKPSGTKSDTSKKKSSQTKQDTPLKKPVLKVKSVTGTKQLLFSWKKVSGADGYRIYQYDAKQKKYTRIAIVKGTSYKADFKFGKSYKFRIRACRKNSAGKNEYGPYSTVVAAKVSSFNKADKVTVRASSRVGDKRITFQWDRVTGADGYKLYLYDRKSGKYKKLATFRNGETTSYTTVKRFGYARTYTFKARAFAYDAEGKIVWGKVTTLQFKTRPSRVRELKVLSKKKNKAVVFWKKVERADGYRIYRGTSENSSSYESIAVVRGNDVFRYADLDVESGKKYYYMIRAFVYDTAHRKRHSVESGIQSVTVK